MFSPVSPKLSFFSSSMHSKNFPQFVVIHIDKGFGVVNKAEVDVLLKLSCFFYDPTNVGNLISDDLGVFIWLQLELLGM